MPRKLKSALLSHQADLAHRASQARAVEHRKAKAISYHSRSTKSPLLTKSKSSTTSTSRTTSTYNRPPTIPFEQTDTILLLGEANFSFAVSLLEPPFSHPPSRICATSYDSEEVSFDKYPDAETIVRVLKERGVRVGFGVDAGILEKSKCVGKGRRWSRVIFNFPHAGAGITDQDRNILSNQHLLLRTFRSVAPILTEGPSAFPIIPAKTKSKRKLRASGDGRVSISPDLDSDSASNEPLDLNPSDLTQPDQPRLLQPPERQGTLLITLLDQPPYTLWDLHHLGTRPPPVCPGTKLVQPRYRLLRSFEFRPDVYRGYEHRRTSGFREGVSKGGNEQIVGRLGKARTWEFALREMS